VDRPAVRNWKREESIVAAISFVASGFRAPRCRAGLARSGLALAILVLALCGCSRPPDAPRPLRFAVIPQGLRLPVSDYARIGAEHEAKRIGGIEILWRGPETADAARQKEILESVVAQRVDGIAVSCVDADVLTPAINRAVEAGIPVVTWDADAPASKRLAFYGISDVEAGEALGRGLGMLLDGTGRVALITALGPDNFQKRLDGAKAALQKFPGIEIVDTFDAGGDGARVAEVIAAATLRDPDLRGWLSVGSWPVRVPNALDPVEPARTKVAAFDTIPPALELMRAGKVDVLVGQKYFGWGAESVKLLKRIAGGDRPAPPFQNSGVDVVTSNNLDAYVAQWRQWESGEAPGVTKDQ
jgi:ribose transport system substrate-binding protein